MTMLKKNEKANIWQFSRSVSEETYGTLFERNKKRPFYDGIKNQTGQMSPAGYKAVIRLADSMKNGADSCAVGTIGDVLVVELTGSDAEERQILVWDDETILISSVKDEVNSSYVLEPGKRDGSVLALAIISQLIAEDTYAEAAMNEIVANFPATIAELDALDEATKDIIKNNIVHLCHKAYSNVRDDKVVFDYPAKNEFSTVNKETLEAGIYSPDTVLAGTFKLATASGTPVSTPEGDDEPTASFVKPEDVVGKYDPNPARVLDEAEEILTPRLEETIIISEDAIEIAETAFASRAIPKAFKNVLIWGPAGTGKSTIARQVAAMRNRPLVVFPCSADTQIYDFVGQVMPIKHQTNEVVKELKAKHGDNITEGDICAQLGIPSMADVMIFPEESYEKLFGFAPATGMMESEIIGECYRSIQPRVDEVIAAISCYGEKTEFAFVETAFIKAMKNGWTVEIQEPNVIAAPGVLPGLNSLLEEGVYTLATGEVIKRHPEAMVIFTTNASYQGCQQMNQSVIDRSDEAYYIASIDKDTMIARTMSASGNTDYKQVSAMVDLIEKITEFMRENGVDDGVCGPRSLLAWAAKVAMGKDAYKAFKTTVLNKCSFDEEFLASIQDIIDNSEFRPARKGARKRKV